MNLSKRDRKVIWHPFTQEKTALLSTGIRKAKGLSLFAEDGREYWDLISSWWVNLHGHAHPKIAAALARQAATLEHILFAGFTHEPAVKLAEKLLRLLPKKIKKVFYSDNGSTSVEIALKMAYQFWLNQGKERKNFIAFEGSYHGDTLGAMSAGKKSGFFNAFKPLLFRVDFMPYPATWDDDAEVEFKEKKSLDTLRAYLKKNGKRTAALIIEPLVQGASGMRFCRESFLQKVVSLAWEYDVLIIFDEVMTGFGRTGEMFACQKVNVAPDMICLSKGLTGGFLPMAATVCSEKIYKNFLGENFSKALAHGHSYTANPLGCAAGLASLEIFEKEKTIQKIQRIETSHREGLRMLKKMCANIEHTRCMGDIAAFEIATKDAGYHSAIAPKLKKLFLKKGLLLRPLGNTVYLMPPYCITPNQIEKAYEEIADVLR